MPRIITDTIKTGFFPYIPKIKKAKTGKEAPATGIPKKLL